jgi:hypothetical protein
MGMRLRLRGSSEKRESTTQATKTASGQGVPTKEMGIGAMPREVATSSQETSPKLMRLRQATKHNNKKSRGHRRQPKSSQDKIIRRNEGDDAEKAGSRDPNRVEAH